MQPNNYKENQASYKDTNKTKTNRFPLVFGHRAVLFTAKNLICIAGKRYEKKQTNCNYSWFGTRNISLHDFTS